MRTAAKRDTNESSIISSLKGIGAAVIQISQKDTFDLLVAFRGKLHILEVKNPIYRAKSKPPKNMLTDGEEKCRYLLESKNVPYHIIFTADEALKIVLKK